MGSPPLSKLNTLLSATALTALGSAALAEEPSALPVWLRTVKVSLVGLDLSIAKGAIGDVAQARRYISAHCDFAQMRRAAMRTRSCAAPIARAAHASATRLQIPIERLYS